MRMLRAAMVIHTHVMHVRHVLRCHPHTLLGLATDPSPATCAPLQPPSRAPCVAPAPHAHAPLPPHTPAHAHTHTHTRTGILNILRYLDTEARKAGGAVYMLNGNHETLNVLGDFRWVGTAACMPGCVGADAHVHVACA